MIVLLLYAFLAQATASQEQEPIPTVPKVVPIPPIPRPQPVPPPAEPTDPHAQTFTGSGVAISLPVGWQLSRIDGELSTFHTDARSASPWTHLEAVATLAFNPYPASTFSGAFFYFSSTPHATKITCAKQATASPNHPSLPAVIDGRRFIHGHDEHGRFCTEARDEILTTYRRGSCLRFDLVINTFCEESSGTRDITPPELDNLRQRLETILYSLQLK